MEQQDPVPPTPIWVNTDDPDPEKHTVNMQMDLVQAFIVLNAIAQGGLVFAESEHQLMAKAITEIAERMQEQYELLGGSEAGIALLRKRKGGE